MHIEMHVDGCKKKFNASRPHHIHRPDAFGYVRSVRFRFASHPRIFERPAAFVTGDDVCVVVTCAKIVASTAQTPNSVMARSLQPVFWLSVLAECLCSNPIAFGVFFWGTWAPEPRAPVTGGKCPPITLQSGPALNRRPGSAIGQSGVPMYPDGGSQAFREPAVPPCENRRATLP
jgi:hypothetical protein